MPDSHIVRLSHYSERLLNMSSRNLIKRFPAYKNPAAEMRKIITAKIILHSIFKVFCPFKNTLKIIKAL